MTKDEWMIFSRHDGTPGDIDRMLNTPELCPPWRDFRKRWYAVTPPRTLLDAPTEIDRGRGEKFRTWDQLVEVVNAALYLRRPLLITGKPGTGKSTWVYAVAQQLGLGKVLRWPVNSRSALKDAIYSYDAIGRLQDAQLQKEPGAPPPAIGKYLRLGPLGTALLPYKRPRALLIDEIDKSDVDLPNDLLNIFEEGEYEIPELARLKEGKASIQVRPHDSDEEVEVPEGRLRCFHFPFVVLTSNGERDFSAPFLRRCLRIEFKPSPEQIREIVKAHLGEDLSADAGKVIDDFLDRSGDELATDQLLNAVFLVSQQVVPEAEKSRKDLIDKFVLRPLSDRMK